jgi:DNA invertase Pin-like site-specific DNA recombinase
MTKRVGCYCRVSTKDQNCDRQIEELREVAENHGWKIVDFYVDEGISGSAKSRPELDRMLKDSMSRKFEMVMTLELSRLGRSVSHMCQIVDLLKSKNIHLFIKNQNVDTSTIVGEFFFNILNSISQYEKDLITERVVSGLESARKKGRIGGRPTNLTSENRTKILGLKAKGVGIRKIAAECSVGIQTVYKVIRAGNPVSEVSVGV